MLKKNRGALTSLSILLSLLVAAVMPFAVFAQDETPPPADAPIVEEVPPAEPPAQEEQPAVEEIPAEEQQPAVEETPAEEQQSAVEETPAEEQQPAVEETPAEEQPVEELTIPEALEQLPEGTDLVVVDEEGEVLPLATEAAAQALSSGDPYFTDGASVIGFSTTGACPPVVTVCNTSATPLSDAINAFAASGTASGAITVEAGTYAAGVTINGSVGNLFNLTGLIGAGSGLTTLTGSISVTNMSNAFTFQGFTLNGAFTASGNSGDLNITDVVQSGSASYGLFVEDHTGNINLSNVTASGNQDFGASLDNTSGTGNVTLTGANVFNNNGTIGLFVFSNGDISASNVTASGNVIGAYLNNSPGTGNVTLTGANIFNTNGENGLSVLSNGDISASNVTASNNAEMGAQLDNTSGTGNVTLTGANVFNTNGLAGLFVDSNGDISASNVTASGNDAMGAALQTPGTVMLTGANVFNGNTYGVYLIGPGSVTINNATISNNSFYGIVNLVGAGNILTLNCVTFSDNASDVNGGGSMVDNGCVPIAPPVVSPVVSGGDGNNLFAPAEIIVPVPVPFEASSLPGPLPSGNAFAAGLNLNLHLNTSLGELVQNAPDGVTVSFEIPESLQGKTFSVLFWEDGKWVSIPVKVVGSVAYFTAYGPGTYVLVTTS
jgi:hypothetical protein